MSNTAPSRADPWWSSPLADGAHHKKPHSPTHPSFSIKFCTYWWFGMTSSWPDDIENGGQDLKNSCHLEGLSDSNRFCHHKHSRKYIYKIQSHESKKMMAYMHDMRAYMYACLTHINNYTQFWLTNADMETFYFTLRHQQLMKYDFSFFLYRLYSLCKFWVE